MIYKLLYLLFGSIRSLFLALLGKTAVGVRALVIKGDQILLVRHTYNQGWYTIGGGIEKGESPLSAIKRELIEEVGLITKDNPILYSVYHNNFAKIDDYVILYLCSDFELIPASSLEIAEKKWFNLNALPDDTSPATIRRIKEYQGTQPISEKW